MPSHSATWRRAGAAAGLLAKRRRPYAAPAAVFVTVPGRKDRLVAKQVATDHTRMVTLLKVDAADLPVPPAVPGEEIRIGQWAVAAAFWSFSTGAASVPAAARLIWKVSLLFVPAFFAVMDDLGNVIWRLSRRFIGGEGFEDKKHAVPGETTPVKPAAEASADKKHAEPAPTSALEAPAE